MRWKQITSTPAPPTTTAFICYWLCCCWCDFSVAVCGCKLVCGLLRFDAAVQSWSRNLCSPHNRGQHRPTSFAKAITEQRKFTLSDFLEYVPYLRYVYMISFACVRVCFVWLAFMYLAQMLQVCLPQCIACIVHSFVQKTFLNSFHFLMNCVLCLLLLFVEFSGRNAGFVGLEVMQLGTSEWI